MTALPQTDKNRFDGAVRYLQLQGVLPAPHTLHEYLELYILRRGSLEITVDGVSNQLYPGDMVILPPFTFHSSSHSPDGELEILMAAPHICPLINGLFHGKTVSDPILRAENVPPLVLALMDRLSTLFPTLPCWKTDDTPARQRYLLGTEDCGSIRPYLSVLLLELENAVKLIPADNPGAGAMQGVLQYCTANFQQELTRDSVSKACKVSPGFISLIFQRLGISFRDYINTLRVSHAYELLVNTKKPITEIIYESGFSNQGTFNRNFQDRFGRSPRDIRHGK